MRKELETQYIMIKDNLENLSKDSDYLSFIQQNSFLSAKPIFDQIYNLANVAIIQYPNIVKSKNQLKTLAKELKVNLSYLKVNKKNWVKDVYVDNELKLKDIEYRLNDLFSLIPDSYKKQKINIILDSIPVSYSMNNEIFINIDQECDLILSEIAHELGHILERQNPEIQAKCLKFILSRSQELVPINDIADDSDKYSDPDKLLVYNGRFFDPYVGKVYDDKQTEVLSMGLQMLILNPELFLFRDCEHFKLIIDILENKHNE